MTTVTEPCPGGSCPAGQSGPQTAFTYDSDNNRTKTTFPNGVVQRASYDSDERVEAIKGYGAGQSSDDAPSLTNLAYSYRSGAGKPTDLRQSVTDRRLDEKTSYGYDSLNRLTSADTKTTDSPAQELEYYLYEYDKNSNLTLRRKRRSGGPDPLDHRYLYDQNNELRCAYAQTPRKGAAPPTPPPTPTTTPETSPAPRPGLASATTQRTTPPRSPRPAAHGSTWATPTRPRSSAPESSTEQPNSLRGPRAVPNS